MVKTQPHTCNAPLTYLLPGNADFRLPCSPGYSGTETGRGAPLSLLLLIEVVLLVMVFCDAVAALIQLLLVMMTMLLLLRLVILLLPLLLN